MKFYHIFLFTLTLIISVNLHSQNSTSSSNNSEDNKLQYLQQKYLEKRESKSLINELNELYAEANKKQDLKMLIFCYNAKIIYFTRIAEMDSVHDFYMPLVKNLSAQLGDSITMERFELMDCHYSMMRGEYDSALVKLKRYMNEASDINKSIVAATLALTYYYIGHYDESIRVLHDALSTDMKNIADTKDTGRIIRTRSTIALVANTHGDYDLALANIDSARMMLNSLDPHIENLKDGLTYDLDCLSARSYLGKKDLKKTKEFLSQAETYLYEGMFEYGEVKYWDIKAEYLYATKEYENALKYLNLSEDFSRRLNNKHDLMRRLQLKAKILYELKRTDEAYLTMNEVYELKDFLSKNILQSQINELHAKYQIDNMELRMEKDKEKLNFIRSIVISLIIVIVLLITLVIIVRMKSKMQKSKNTKLLSQYLELRDYMTQIKVLTSNNGSQDESAEDKEDALFVQINNFLEENQGYKDNTLTREKLAFQLGTNRQYLTDAIKAGSGKSFNDYINDIRLEYASRRLIEDKNVFIGDIYQESGFYSRATFNRLFKNKFGMAPNELRMVVENMESIEEVFDLTESK